MDSTDIKRVLWMVVLPMSIAAILLTLWISDAEETPERWDPQAEYEEPQPGKVTIVEWNLEEEEDEETDDGSGSRGRSGEGY